MKDRGYKVSDFDTLLAAGRKMGFSDDESEEGFQTAIIMDIKRFEDSDVEKVGMQSFTFGCLKTRQTNSRQKARDNMSEKHEHYIGLRAKSPVEEAAAREISELCKNYLGEEKHEVLLRWLNCRTKNPWDSGPMKEFAEELGVSREALNVRCHRMIAKLKEKLVPEEVGE